MKKIAFACLAAISLILTACPGPNSIPDDPVVLTVQEAIDKADDSVVLETGLTLEENESITVSKGISISGGSTAFDMKGATFTIDASGVTLSNLTNVKEVIVSEKVGDGDFILSSCNVGKITVQGGGANSIHLEGSTVLELTVQKESVRIVLEKGCEVETTKVLSNCTLDSADETAKFKTVATDKKVTEVKLEGQVCVQVFVASSTETTVIIETEDVVIEKAGAVTTDSQGNQTVVEIKIEAGENVAEEKLPEIKVIEEKELEQFKEELKDVIVDSSEPEISKDPESKKDPEGSKDPESSKDPDPAPNPNPEGNPYYIELVEVEGKPGITVKLNKIPTDSTGIQYYIYCVTEGVLEANNDAYISPASAAYTEYYYPFVTPGNEYEVYVGLNSPTQAKTATRTITPKTGVGSLKSTKPHNFNFNEETNVITFNAPVYSTEIPKNGTYWVNCFIGESGQIYMGAIPNPEPGAQVTFDIAVKGNKSLIETFAGQQCSFDAEYLFTYNGYNYAIQFLDGWQMFTPIKNVEIDRTVSERLKAVETGDGIEITVKLLNGERSVNEWWSNLKEVNTNITVPIHCNSKMPNSEETYGNKLNEGESITILYPFVKAGTTYEFTIDGKFENTDGGVNWGGETVKITATKTNSTWGNVYPVKWNTTVPTVSYDSEDEKYTITTPNYTKEDFESDFGESFKDKCYLGIACFVGKANFKEPYCALAYYGGGKEVTANEYFYNEEGGYYKKFEVSVELNNLPDGKTETDIETVKATQNTYCAYMDITLEGTAWKLNNIWSAEISYPSN